MSHDPLKFGYEYGTDVITIEGIPYAAQLFRDLSSPLHVGQHFTVESNDNGHLTLSRLSGCKPYEEDKEVKALEKMWRRNE